MILQKKYLILPLAALSIFSDIKSRLRPHLRTCCLGMLVLVCPLVSVAQDNCQTTKNKASNKASLCPIITDIKVALKPVATGIDLVTDINVVDDYFYICTQPGLLLRKKMDSGSQTDAEVVLDLRKEVGTLGKNIPALPGLGYPVPGTYDERGLLGFAADPDFSHNGRYWVWYSSINDYTTPAPNFFQWLISTSTPWNQSEYDHIDHLVEYKKDSPPRTLLKLKRPYFNHTGYASVVWSPEHNTLLLALGDGGSENDPNALAQDNDQLSGKLLKSFTRISLLECNMYR